MSELFVSLEDVVRAIDGALRRTWWVGPNGSAFMERWSSRDAVLIGTVVVGLRDASVVLARNADEQERASSAGAVTGGHGATPASTRGGAVLASHDASGAVPVPGEAGLALLLAGNVFRDAQERTAANRAWWDGMSSAEQERLAGEHVLMIGQLDGLPSAFRHAANVAGIEQEIERIESAITSREREIANMSSLELRGLPPELGSNGTLAQYREDLVALRELRRAIESNDDLLVLDLRADEHPVRAAVSVGDPDTADYVSVHVAGTGSNVEKIAGDVDRATSIRDESQRLLRHEGEHGVVASVVWAGYDAPDVIVSEAMERRFAEEGAPDFAAFGEGLRVAAGPEAKITASGHSYGSTVVALELQETGAFDAFVASGSPGFGTENSLEVQIPTGQVYVSYYDMPGDVVAASGAHGDRPQTLPGVTITDNGPRSVTFADGTQSNDIGPGETWYWQHSDYWDKGRAALFNQAAITVGREDLVATR